MNNVPGNAGAPVFTALAALAREAKETHARDHKQGHGLVPHDERR